MKYALIIGNNQYDDPKLAQLKTPAADSQALAEVLADKNIGSFDEVTPLINKTETEIRRAISGFLTNKKPDDLVLVYFSGHGVLDDRGRLFLSLKDTETNLLKATAIPSTYISDEMDSCRSKRQVLILDCCHSGAFERGTKGEQKAVTEATFEGSGYGRVVMTASDSTQYALEGDRVIGQTDLSLFTHFLLEGLKTGEADIDNDGHISLDEWYDYTYARVISETPKQIPHRWSYNQQGDLIIARNPNARKKFVELPAELVQAVESPFTTIRESALNELGRLLNSRDPELAELARLSLVKMTGDDSRRISSSAEKVLSDYERSHTPVLGREAPPSTPVIEMQTETVSVTIEDATPSLNKATEIESPPRESQPDIEKISTSAESPSSTREFVFDRTFWFKWIGTSILAFVASILLFYNYTIINDSAETLRLQFGIAAGAVGLLQWYLFRDRLEIWWVGVNAAIGFGLGSLYKNLHNEVGWSNAQQGLIYAVWIMVNFILGLVLLNRPQDKSRKSSPIIETGARQSIPLMFLSISLLLAAASNIVISLPVYELINTLLILYGFAAILTGISFILKNEIPRNFGFITLIIFLLLDGINCELIAFNSAYPQYFFGLNGITALASGIYFASQKETWKNLGFILLSGYLITTGLSSIFTYSTDLGSTFSIIATLFAIPTAVFFFLRK